MKRLTTPVRCSVCGKKLRGQESIMGGFRVSAHRGLDGKPCAGRNTYAHRPIVKKA